MKEQLILNQEHIASLNNIILELPTKYGVPILQLFDRIQKEQPQIADQEE